MYVTVIISPCKIQPVPETGQVLVGPSVEVTVKSYSNTPESGDTSTIASLPAVVLPIVAMVVEEEPLSILTVIFASSILSSPCADVL